MCRLARSVYVYSLYLLVMGAALLLLPGWFDALLAVAPTDHGWLRLIGLLAAVIGLFYLAIGRSDHTDLCRVTVFTRIVAFVGISLLVWTRQLPQPFLVLGLIDLASAAWTWRLAGRTAFA